MAENELKSHLDWFTWETIIRQNIPLHALETSASHPTKLVRAKESHDDLVKEYLQTIDSLRKENDELKKLNQSKDNKIHELTTEHEPLKANMIQAETLPKLEGSLKDYRERIFELEKQLKELGVDLQNGKAQPINLNSFLEAAKQNSDVLTAQLISSEDNLKSLTDYFKVSHQPLDDLVNERNKIYPVLVFKTYSPQEKSDLIQKHLDLAKSKSLLLEKHEALKTQLLADLKTPILNKLDLQVTENLLQSEKTINLFKKFNKIPDNVDAEAKEAFNGRILLCKNALTLENIHRKEKLLAKLEKLKQDLINNPNLEHAELPIVSSYDIAQTMEELIYHSENTLALFNELALTSDANEGLKQRRIDIAKDSADKNVYLQNLGRLQIDHELLKQLLLQKLVSDKNVQKKLSSEIKAALIDDHSIIHALSTLSQKQSPEIDSLLQELKDEDHSLQNLVEIQRKQNIIKKDLISDIPSCSILAQCTSDLIGRLGFLFEQIQSLKEKLKPSDISLLKDLAGLNAKLNEVESILKKAENQATESILRESLNIVTDVVNGLSNTLSTLTEEIPNPSTIQNDMKRLDELMVSSNLTMQFLTRMLGQAGKNYHPFINHSELLPKIKDESESFSERWEGIKSYIEIVVRNGLSLENLKRNLAEGASDVSTHASQLEKLNSNLHMKEKSMVKLKSSLPSNLQNSITADLQSASDERKNHLNQLRNAEHSRVFIIESINHLISIEEKYSELLKRIVEGLLEEEIDEYDETEEITKIVRKKVGNAVIVGDISGVKNQMDKLLETVEVVLIDSYHKLHIDDEKIKILLQGIIDERKSLRERGKPLENLFQKQEFGEKQFKVLQELINSANSLSYLIESFEGIERSQLEIQQLSQLNFNGLKELLNKKPEEKRFLRKKTYLSVSHAEPTSAREGLDVLTDLLSSIKRNQNVINDLENAKQRLLENSDLGQEAEIALETISNDIQEEKPELQKTFDTLLNIEDNQENAQKCNELMNELDFEPYEKSRSQLEGIKKFINLTTRLIPLKLSQEKLLGKLIGNMDKDHTNYLNWYNKLQFNENELQSELDRLRKVNREKHDEISHLTRLMDKLSGERKQINEQLNNKAQEVSDTQSKADDLQEILRRQEEELMSISTRIGQILVKTDVVGDTLMDILPDNKLKQEMDDYQDGFETLMKKIEQTGKASIEDLNELLNLLANYEGANIVQASRLSGKRENEIIEDIKAVNESSKIRPNMQRAKKVRSAKPAESPLETIDKATNFLLQDAGTVLYGTHPDDPVFEEAKKYLNEPDQSVSVAILDKLKLTRSIIKKIEADNSMLKEQLKPSERGEEMLINFREAIDKDNAEIQKALKVMAEVLGEGNDLEDINNIEKNLNEVKSARKSVSTGKPEAQIAEECVMLQPINQKKSNLLNKLANKTKSIREDVEKDNKASLLDAINGLMPQLDREVQIADLLNKLASGTEDQTQPLENNLHSIKEQLKSDDNLFLVLERALELNKRFKDFNLRKLHEISGFSEEEITEDIQTITTVRKIGSKAPATRTPKTTIVPSEKFEELGHLLDQFRAVNQPLAKVNKDLLCVLLKFVEKSQNKEPLAQIEDYLTIRPRSDICNALIDELKQLIPIKQEELQLSQLIKDQLKQLRGEIIGLEAERSKALEQEAETLEITISPDDAQHKAELDYITATLTKLRHDDNDSLLDTISKARQRLLQGQELARIKKETASSAGQDEALTRKLQEIEITQYKGLKESLNVLSELVNKFGYGDTEGLRNLTQPSSVSTAAPELLSSISSALKTSNDFEAKKLNIILNEPGTEQLKSILNQVREYAQKDQTQTTDVLFLLLKFIGSEADKSSARNLEAKIDNEEPQNALETIKLLEKNLNTWLPTMEQQTNLISKIASSGENLINTLADAEELCNDVVRKALKETMNAVPINDASSKKTLDGLKSEAQDIADESSPTLEKKMDNIIRNSKLLDKLENLRRKLREDAQKQFNGLKNELQVKENELNEVKVATESKVKDLESAITALDNSVKERENMIKKLTTDASDREVELSKLRNQVSDLTSAAEVSQENYNRLDEENSDNNKTIRNLRKQIKEKEDEIKELNDRIMGLEKSAMNKGGVDENVVNQLRKEIKELKEVISEKNKEIEHHVDEYNKKKRDHEIQLKECQAHLTVIQNQKEELGQLKLKIMGLETKNAELQDRNRLGAAIPGENEINDILKELESKDQLIAQLKDQMGPLTVYRKLYQIMKTDSEQVEKDREENDIDISELIRRIKMLTHENEQLKYKCRMIDKYQRDYLSIGQENARLSKKLEYYQDFLDQEGNSNFNDMSNKLTLELSQKVGTINELKEKIDELVNDVKRIKLSREITVKRQIMLRLLQLARMGVSMKFSQWKAAADEPRSDQREDPEVVTKLSQTIQATLDRELAGLSEIPIDQDIGNKTTSIILEERKQALTKSAIINAYKHSAVRSERPMSKGNMKKIFEDMIDSKYDVDMKDISDGRLPKGIPEYFVNYLVMCYGSKKNMMPYLSQFLPSLRQNYDEGDIYAKVISRLLQVYDSNPVLNDDSHAIVKVFKDTKPLVEKAKSNLADRRAGKVDESHEEDIFLADAIDFAYELFKQDKETGKIALSLLQPGNMTSSDVTVFKLMHALKKTQVTPLQAFNNIKSGDNLTQDDFLKLNNLDNVWITSKELLNLYSTLQPIDSDKFSSAFNIQNYDTLTSKDNDIAIIPRSQLIIAIIEASTETQIQDIAWCLSLLKGKSSIQFQEFKELINEIAPDLNDDQIASMYDIGLMWSSDPENGITGDSLYKILKKHQLGRFSHRATVLKIIVKEKVRRIVIEETKDISETLSPRSLSPTTTEPRSGDRRITSERTEITTVESSQVEEEEEEEVKKTVRRRTIKKKK